MCNLALSLNLECEGFFTIFGYWDDNLKSVGLKHRIRIDGPDDLNLRLVSNKKKDIIDSCWNYQCFKIYILLR